MWHLPLSLHASFSAALRRAVLCLVFQTPKDKSDFFARDFVFSSGKKFFDKTTVSFV
jgi:hypothetical protein